MNMSGPPCRSPNHPLIRDMIVDELNPSQRIQAHDSSDKHMLTMKSSSLSPHFNPSLLERGMVRSSPSNIEDCHNVNIKSISSVVNFRQCDTQGSGIVYPHHIKQKCISIKSSRDNFTRQMSSPAPVSFSSRNPVNVHIKNAIPEGTPSSFGSRSSLLEVNITPSKTPSRIGISGPQNNSEIVNWYDRVIKSNNKNTFDNNDDDEYSVNTEGDTSFVEKRSNRDDNLRHQFEPIHSSQFNTPLLPYNKLNSNESQKKSLNRFENFQNINARPIKSMDFTSSLDIFDADATKPYFQSTITNPFTKGNCDTKRLPSYTLDSTSTNNQLDTKLRKLILHAIGLSNSSPSSHIAAFFGSILYVRSPTDENAFLYARALVANDEGRRAVRILDKAQLLFCTSKYGFCSTNALDYEQSHNWETIRNCISTTMMVKSNSKRSKVMIESIILAAQYLSKVGEWEDALCLLENGCRYPLIESRETSEHNPSHHHSVETFIESGDDPRLLLLAEYVRPTTLHGDLQFLEEEVHPIARLCSLRGVAYDEFSNPTRATSFLIAALRIDSGCIEAWDYLFSRHLLSNEKERLLVMGLKFSDGMDWLRDIYFARVSTSRRSCSVGFADDYQVVKEEKSRGKLISVDEDEVGKFPKDTWNITFFKHNINKKRGMELLMEVHDLDIKNPSLIQNCDTPSSLISHMPMSASRSESTYDYLGQINEKIEEVTIADNERNYAMRKNKINAKLCSLGMKEVINALYNISLKYCFSRSPEILSIAAMHAYTTHDLPSAYLYAKTLFDVDPLYTTASYVHVATLTCLGHTRSLFHLAHEFVKANPKSAYAWYAVGCYYYSCGRNGQAQRHFCRATRLDPRSTECWIAFGCSFAASDESDQALASFRAARRLHPGSYHPMLYMGMEYLRTNHLVLAGHFLRNAKGMGSDDPLCYNELGVLAFRRGEWEEAAKYFLVSLRLCTNTIFLCRQNLKILDVNDTASSGTKCGKHLEENTLPYLPAHYTPLPAFSAEMGYSKPRDSEQLSSIFQHPAVCFSLELIELCQDKFWEPTIFNLGQSFRKSKRFCEATICFEKCRSIYPGQADPYTALGFTKHLMGDLNTAIEYYHQALSLKPDDPVASEMLNRALHETLNDMDTGIFKSENFNNKTNDAKECLQH